MIGAHVHDRDALRRQVPGQRGKDLREISFRGGLAWHDPHDFGESSARRTAHVGGRDAPCLRTVHSPVKYAVNFFPFVVK